MRKEFIECKTRATAVRHAPWAFKIVKCEGGYMAFESSAEYHAWKHQN